MFRNIEKQRRLERKIYKILSDFDEIENIQIKIGDDEKSYNHESFSHTENKNSREDRTLPFQRENDLNAFFGSNIFEWNSSGRGLGRRNLNFRPSERISSNIYNHFGNDSFLGRTFRIQDGIVGFPNLEISRMGNLVPPMYLNIGLPSEEKKDNPLNKQVRESLIKRKLKESEIGEKCSICISEYTKEQEVTVLPCNHIFHSQCIDEWFDKESICPNCRYDLQLKD